MVVELPPHGFPAVPVGTRNW